MTRATLSLLAALVLSAAGPADASESSSVRCPGGRIVGRGDTPYQVRNRCGDPDDTQQRREYRTIKVKVRTWVAGVMHEFEEDRTVEVLIDEWTYDFGENRFIRLMRFEDGKLAGIFDGTGKGSKAAD